MVSKAKLILGIGTIKEPASFVWSSESICVYVTFGPVYKRKKLREVGFEFREFGNLLNLIGQNIHVS